MIFESDMRYEIRNMPTNFLYKYISEELTDRELYDLVLELYENMDSTYKQQFVDSIR